MATDDVWILGIKMRNSFLPSVLEHLVAFRRGQDPARPNRPMVHPPAVGALVAAIVRRRAAARRRHGDGCAVPLAIAAASGGNAAATAFRTATLQIVLSRPGSSKGAIVAPVLTADGCIGARARDGLHQTVVWGCFEPNAWWPRASSS